MAKQITLPIVSGPGHEILLDLLPHSPGILRLTSCREQRSLFPTMLQIDVLSLQRSDMSIGCQCVQFLRSSGAQCL